MSGTTYAWYEVDVTSYLQAEKAAGRNVASLALRIPAASSLVLTTRSREDTSRAPHLSITP